jgi:hypothetical protein
MSDDALKPNRAAAAAVLTAAAAELAPQQPSRGATIRRWSQLQAVTGIGIGTFATLHLTNLLAAPGGGLFYDETQQYFRGFYHSRAVEVLLGTSILLHGVAVFARSQSRNDARFPLRFEVRGPLNNSIIERMHRTSGSLLLIMIGGHVATTRIVPDFVLNIMPAEKSGLIANSLNGPARYFFFPYYVCLGTCGFVHLLTGFKSFLCCASVF